MTALLISFSGVPAYGCGPFFDQAIFTYTVHPSLPLDTYAAGELGILRPQFARSYLVVAYRYLTGKPLSPEERTSAVSLWRHRLAGASDSGALSRAVKKWLDTRKKVQGVKGVDYIDSYRPVESSDAFSQYLNCPPDAFDTAATTLQKRIDEFGAGSPVIQDWVKAQDQVFCHCSGPQYDWKTNKPGAEPPLPQPAPAGSPPVIEADRSYQIAAAEFYAQRFAQARKSFEKIAADPASPWSGIAPYLVARSMVRQATLSKELDTALLREALKRVESILQNKSMAAVDDDARALLDFIKFKLYPDQRRKELAETLSLPGSGADFETYLYDYTVLLDNYIDSSPDGSESGSPAPPAKLPPDAAPLTEWLLTFQSSGTGAVERSIEQWKKTGSLPWLVASLYLVPAGNAASSELLAAAEKVEPGSPGYLTAAYAAVKLRRSRGEDDSARSMLDRLLPLPGLSASARNLLVKERLELSRSYEDFLAFAVQRPALVTADVDGNEMPNDPSQGFTGQLSPGPPAFAGETARFLNHRVPLALLVKTASSPRIPAPLKKSVVRAVWTRAALLEDANATRQLTPLLKELEPSLAKYLQAYDAASGAAAKRFAAAYLFLKFPGMTPYVPAGVERSTPLARIDDYRDNWWCAGQAAGFEGQESDDNSAGKRPPFFAVLTAAERAAGEAENRKLAALGTAPNYLCAQVVARAAAAPADSRLPEALHLAVKSTRFGCTDDATTKFSKEAFQILHKQYPGSPWTAKTKYWY